MELDFRELIDWCLMARQHIKVNLCLPGKEYGSAVTLHVHYLTLHDDNVTQSTLQLHKGNELSNRTTYLL